VTFFFVGLLRCYWWCWCYWCYWLSYEHCIRCYTVNL